VPLTPAAIWLFIVAMLKIFLEEIQQANADLMN